MGRERFGVRTAMLDKESRLCAATHATIVGSAVVLSVAARYRDAYGHRERYCFRSTWYAIWGMRRMQACMLEMGLRTLGRQSSFLICRQVLRGIAGVQVCIMCVVCARNRIAWRPTGSRCVCVYMYALTSGPMLEWNAYALGAHPDIVSLIVSHALVCLSHCQGRHEEHLCMHLFSPASGREAAIEHARLDMSLRSTYFETDSTCTINLIVVLRLRNPSAMRPVAMRI